MNFLAEKIVKMLLRTPHGLNWTVQGLGMLRAYIDDNKEIRLHIWDKDLIVPEVSTIHTHPWEFTSYIISGEILDTKLVESKSEFGQPYFKQSILCGEGGGLEGEPELVHLINKGGVLYRRGEQYCLWPDEIHDSQFKDGTVTIIQRKFGEDVDHAYVYWDEGEVWGSAEPRPAAKGEIERACNKALESWG